MEFLEQLLPMLFYLVIIPAIGALTIVIVGFIKDKKEELKEKTDNDLLKKYIDMLSDTICSCVVATNQTYVNYLKEKGEFDAEAQKEAFNRTYEAVMKILSDEAVVYLTEFYGDLQVAITEMIEENVAIAWNRKQDKV